MSQSTNGIGATVREHSKLALLAVATVGLVMTAVVQVNAASPQLVDRAAAAGINYASTPSWDVCVADVNGDGNDDFHASLHMKNPGLLEINNNNGTFTRIASTVVSPRPTPGYGSKAFEDRHACAFADVDGNGLMDLYSVAGRWASNKYKDEGINNELFLQTAPGVFKDGATAAGIGEPCTRGRYAVFADFNGDGRPDLFISAQKERADSSDVCNKQADYPYTEQSKVYVNRGNDANGVWLGFRTAPEYNVSQDSTGSRAALAWDYDHDGKTDLLALSFANKVPLLYHNNGTSFTLVSTATVKLPMMNGMTIADVTGDGLNDLVYADNNGFAYLRGTATGVNTTPVRLGANITTAGDGWNVAVGDINGDGLADVYGQTSSATGGGNPDDIVYVAQPNGTFVAYVAPSAGGDANDVAAVRVQGRAQFVVLNGGNDEKEAPGPVQIIAWKE